MHKHANVWWSLQLHELCAIHTDSLFPAALAAVLSSCAATVEPSLLRGGTAPGRHGHQTTVEGRGGLRKLWMSSFRKIYKIIYTNSIEFV
jgi:hypothetical protein